MDINSVYDVIAYIDDTAKTTVERGDMWERVTTFYLRSDPQMQQLIGQVWRWADAPTHDGHDTGIDVVAEDITQPADEPHYWAIQCKNYDPSHKFDFKELSTFFATAAANKQYTGYMLVLSSDEYTANLESHCEKTGTVIITPTVMDQSNIDWSEVFSKESSGERETYDLREHQRDAVKQINAALQVSDRCKSIMACGTGKTLMSLRLAEDRCNGGDVLFCAPSIALVSQAMREWTNQARTQLRTLVVCSDAKASKVKDSDFILDTVADLAYPATTDAETLKQRYSTIRAVWPDATIAIFVTYQSMQVIQDAQALGIPEFDLIICDEAHRTTGVKDETMTDADVSSFQIVHNNDRIKGFKRVYMTATPRIYSDQAKQKARQDDYTLSSMDDERIYGPVAYELTFADAVERGLLCDYRVVVLSISEDAISPYAQHMLSNGSELQMDDVAKIIGCYKGLATHGALTERRLSAASAALDDSTPDFFLIDEISEERDTTTAMADENPADVKPLQRAVGFCARIKDSQRMGSFFKQVVDNYKENTGDDLELSCCLDHVDGGMDSKVRLKKLDWLADGNDEHECRILTNARCLAEGIDVPSLDAVIFFAPRKSEVDIVQAVGRVMRSFTNKVTGEKKELGYIILPVFVPAGMTPEESLDRSNTFDVVWKVLQALRSHDERIDAYVNALPFRKKVQPGTGTPIGTPAKEPPIDVDNPVEPQLPLVWDDTLSRAIYTKMVQRCGTKIYWETWADDVARIAQRHIEQIEQALAEDVEAHETFDEFLQGLRNSLNPGIKESDAIEMVAQHMITLPVFDALFGDWKFASSNPVSIAIDGFINSLEGHGVGDMDITDRRNLDDLYASVRRRAKIVQTDFGRQELIRDLYENFFSKAFKATSEKLGIVYTPSEVIEYILYATDRVLWREFGHKLADEGVHILDPFAGTGSFIARFIENPDLVPVSKLKNKYLNELHSNEILLLAYYIMVVNIEYAYHSRVGGEYEAFPGGVLADTFQMTENSDERDLTLFIDNTQRAWDQEALDITVIVGNPPYSIGQRNANDDNANESYPHLDKRIETTYAALSKATRQSALYDSYIRAFRWASDRIGNAGVICFVTNAGWMKSATGDGVRRCFADEFSSIYVIDLRGHKQYRRMTKEQMAAEGDNVFASGSTAAIAITMLVKNPDSTEHGVIRYVDVGEYKTREEKLEYLLTAANMEPNWQILEPDIHGDWLNQRNDSYAQMAPLGILDGTKKTSLGMFSIWSLGVATNRDAWVWGYSREAISNNVLRLMDNTNKVIDSINGDISRLVFDSKRYSWTRSMQGRAKRQERLTHSGQRIIKGEYRPFTQEYLYFDSQVNEVTYQLPSLFPLADAGRTLENIAISVPGKSNSGFYCLINKHLTDLNYMSAGAQAFPLYWYERINERPQALFSDKCSGLLVKDAWGNRYIRHDAITDETLEVFKAAYPDAFFGRPKTKGGIGATKEDIFFYVYGVLHSPIYREKYASNLAKELPRIPLAKDFEAFVNAGRALADLHLNYENVEPWQGLDMGILPGADPGRVEKMMWAKKTDPETGKKVADYTHLIYNKSVTVSNIPEGANAYVLNGKSPLEWMIDRYQVKTDKASGIVNDPNEYSDDPRYILDLIGRLVTVSMKTQEIIAGLPGIDEVEHPANWPAAWKVEM